MKTISLPFRFDGYGHVAATSDMAKIYSDRVISAVLTSIGERLMRPSFGSEVSSIPFDSIDDVADELSATVSLAFQNFLTDLTFVDVTFEDQDPYNGEIELSIDYLVPQSVSDQPQTTQVTVYGGSL